MATTNTSLTRRGTIAAALAAAGGIAAINGAAWAARPKGAPVEDAVRARHARDWEWHVGRWNVRHRRLKERLRGSTEWEEFNGTTEFRLLMGGLATIDDNVFESAGGAYRGIGIQAFDVESGEWLAYWLDGRDPGRIGQASRGKLKDGVWTFMSDETFEGRSIKVRQLFREVDTKSAHWEQAFSPDGGATWEVNWIARYTRAG